MYKLICKNSFSHIPWGVEPKKIIKYVKIYFRNKIKTVDVF